MGLLEAGNDRNKEEFVIKGVDVNFTPELKGLGHAYFHSMKRNKHAIAQNDAATGTRDTYGDLLNRSVRTALEMRSRGISRDDVVTICSPNHVNSCVPLIAAAFLGAKMCCLDPALSPADTLHLVRQIRPKMAFVGPEAVDLVERAFEEARVEVEIVVFGASAEHSEFADFFAPKSCEHFEPVEVDDNKETAVILFSSGTTGMPKGICISHFGLLGQAHNMKYVGYNLDVCLSYASFYWISTTLLMTGCILSGGCRLIVPRYNPRNFWKLLDQFKVTLTFMAPSQAIDLYNRGRPDGINTTSLCDAIIGGGPISAEYVTKIREILPGTHVAIIYGQTETTGTALCFQPNVRDQVMNMYKKPGSSGMVMAGTACKVVDPVNGAALGPNQRGELRIKSKFVGNGYWNMDSSSVWDEDGWLRTGDVVYYDDDRYFYVVDRIKEMLKFQGYHVPPAAIESVILTHPAVAMAVVVGIPNEEDGDHPAAAVILKDPNAGVEVEEIAEYVAERVDDKQRLRGGVKFFDKLPLTVTGKIKRIDVRNMMLDG